MSIEKDILKGYKTVAVVGVSANPDRPSNRVAGHLKENGYKIIPVNPKEKMVLGETCYSGLGMIPEQVEVVDIFRRSEEVLPIVQESIKIGAKAVWMQEGVVNKEAAESARKAGLKVVIGQVYVKGAQEATE